MAEIERKPIDTSLLPSDWRKIGAEKFGCSVSKIEKVAYRITNDKKILTWLIEQAEDGLKEAQLIEDRIANATLVKA